MSSFHFNAPNQINNYNNHSKQSNDAHVHIENDTRGVQNGLSPLKEVSSGDWKTN